MRKINLIAPWRTFLLLPFVLLLRLWNKTLRIHISDKDREFFLHFDKPVIFAFWHDGLFVAHEIHRRFRKRKIYGLISASKDGAWLAAVYNLLGIGAVRGSSSWRGKEAFRELISTVQQGNDIAITPDGPRGPRHVMKRGVLEIAKQTQAVGVFATIEFSSCWQLNSWDAFSIPKPFSKITVSLRPL
ncbi:MAG: hypothetical protein A2007_04715 [Verrucomicrobia bacterium GWC2_42_7]|nr:MAG: hypothetical protein A2007_04715 [Verrucomicrobia bacterium GWC2_42_7]